LDLGSGKATKKEMAGIPHHLLDVASPKRKFSVAQFQKQALKTIDNILKRNKTPFLVGGSAFYLYSIIEGWQFPQTKRDEKLRKVLEKKTKKQLFSLLKGLDPKRAKVIEKNNKRRLIRAIEIAKQLGNVPKIKKKPKYNCLVLGLKQNNEDLKKLIKIRLLKRMRQGMFNEVKQLRSEGISWQRLEGLGLEYKWLALYLQNKIKKDEMLEKLATDIYRFAKRQMTWFKKDETIHWLSTNKKERLNQAQALIDRFI
ncbi:tRNA (adenosine(37)-N6)-dimethylallyltransferase MiaA, partial [Candidatus Gribaldobacteria bacterium]|nr:tRNA (adenosine(37)-N6)-dimethylallyltransferase MiaA [Candidatus Gribaldobacteria bacterium]